MTSRFENVITTGNLVSIVGMLIALGVPMAGYVLHAETRLATIEARTSAVERLVVDTASRESGQFVRIEGSIQRMDDKIDRLLADVYRRRTDIERPQPYQP